MGHTLLSSSTITGGTFGNDSGSYKLGSNHITETWNMFTETQDKPSCFTTNSANSTGSFNGWANPSYVLEGWFDQSSTDSSFIHRDTLRRFATLNLISNTSSAADIYLVDDVYGTIRILIDSITIEKLSENISETAAGMSPLTSGTLMPYTINFRETQ